VGLFDTFTRGFETRVGETTLLSDPAGWLYEAFGVTPTDAGVSVSPHSSLRYTAVYACVNVLAQTTAQVPWDVYRLQGKTKQIARDRTEHYLLHTEPSGLMTSYSFRMGAITNLLLYGNFYAEIIRDGAARVRALRLIPSFTVTAYESLDQSRVIYQVTRPDGKIDLIDGSDMIHVPYLSENGISGLSPIALHRQSVGLGLAAETAGAAFFGNGSRLSGYLYSTKNLRAEDREDLEQKWFSKFGGARNSGRVPVLSGDIKWQQLGIPPSDAQYLETRNFQAADIARIYRVPAVLAGLADKTATYASAEAFFQSFVQFTMAPIFVSVEQEFDRKLFPNTDELYCKFDMKGLLRGDPKGRSMYYKEMFATGSIKQDEIRDYEDMDPLPNGLGDRTWVQQGFMPLDKADEILAKQGSGKPAPGGEPNQDPNSADAGRAKRDAHVAWMQDVLDRVNKWEKKDQARIAEAMAPVFRSLRPHCKDTVVFLPTMPAAEIIDTFLHISN
jgi:HK97 family phage portal protein